MDDAPRDGTELLLIVENKHGLWCMLVGHYMPGGHCIEDHPAIDSGWYFWNMSEVGAEKRTWLEFDIDDKFLDRTWHNKALCPSCLKKIRAAILRLDTPLT
jgi:hypothetical protein